MTNAELADRLAEAKRVAIAPPTSDKWEDMTIDEREQIIAVLRKPCPYIVTDKDGTSYCSLAEPSSDKVLVPREPTQEMMDAGYATAAFPRDPEICIAMYRAMLAAAEAEGR